MPITRARVALWEALYLFTLVLRSWERGKPVRLPTASGCRIATSGATWYEGTRSVTADEAPREPMRHPIEGYPDKSPLPGTTRGAVVLVRVTLKLDPSSPSFDGCASACPARLNIVIGCPLAWAMLRC